jgi:hypothetical protein
VGGELGDHSRSGIEVVDYHRLDASTFVRRARSEALQLMPSLKRRLDQ